MPSIQEIREKAKQGQYQLLFNNLKNLEAGLHRTAIEWEEEPPPEECAGGVMAGDGEQSEETLGEEGSQDQDGQDSDQDQDQDQDGQSADSANEGQDGQRQDGGGKQRKVKDLNERRKEQQRQGQSQVGKSDKRETGDHDEDEPGREQKHPGWQDGHNLDKLDGHDDRHDKQKRRDLGISAAHICGRAERMEHIDPFGRTVHVYQTFCSCGWSSKIFRSEAAAESESYRHMAQQAGYVK